MLQLSLNGAKIDLVHEAIHAVNIANNDEHTCGNPSNVCSPHGSCLPLGRLPLCLCELGHTGPYCQTGEIRMCSILHYKSLTRVFCRLLEKNIRIFFNRSLHMTFRFSGQAQFYITMKEDIQSTLTRVMSLYQLQSNMK